MVITQSISPPSHAIPIFIVGAGGIVRDAHLPAYQKAGFNIVGIYDRDAERAEAMRISFPGIGKVYDSVQSFIDSHNAGAVVYDVAVPAAEILSVLKQLPNGAVVLMQKPMGESIAGAREILRLCKEKSLTAAVNLQLKYAPLALAAQSLIQQGVMGKVYDVEVMVCVYTPWHLWDFLVGKPRVEILYHSIHYLDLVRSMLGDPNRIYSSTVKHPSTPGLAATRSTIILNYDEYTQARIITNHGHGYGAKEQVSYLKIEGTKGAIKAQIGVSLDYPNGMPDTFSYVSEQTGEWTELPLTGNWFPDAFIGSMTALQRFAHEAPGDKLRLLRDNYRTMELVEAAYQSSISGGLSFNTIL